MNQNKMKLLFENWRKYLNESKDIDLLHDQIYRYEDMRISFAKKISDILFLYQGKNSISGVDLQDRIALAAQPNTQVQLFDGAVAKTPTQEEINLFRQEAEMLFDSLEADRTKIAQAYDTLAKQFDKYIDLFINLTNDSEDQSYEGRLEHIQDLVKQIGYEEEPIYSQQQRDFVQSLIVKPLKGAKDPKHPFPVGSVKDKKMKKLGLSGLLEPLRKQFKPTRKGGLSKGKIKAYNDALGKIWGSMADLVLKPTHEEAMAKLGPVGESIFAGEPLQYKVRIPRGQNVFKREVDRENSEFIPVTEFAKDKYQLALMHYFNPNNLRMNAQLADEGADKSDAEIRALQAQLGLPNDPMEQRIIQGQIARKKLERNMNRKRARLIRKDMEMYKAGFENRMEGKDSALPIPRRYGTAQYTGYGQASGFDNLAFGGAPANIYKDTGVKGRTVEDEDDVLRTLEYYLDEVGGEIPSPMQDIYNSASDEDKHAVHSMLFLNYVHTTKVAAEPAPREPEPASPTGGIESLDDLDMDDLDYYMNELNFADAPVQGTGDDGDIDLDDPANIEWMVGEINKIMQSEGS
jgi:hypothetical protein